VETAIERDGLEALLPDWGQLFDEDPDATPFSSPQWGRVWWEHWSEGAEPWLVTVRESGRLIGLAPLLRRRRGPFRTLHGIGRTPGDYWDLIAAAGRREEVSEAVADELRRRRSEWDALLLDSVHSGEIGGALLRGGFRTQARSPVVSVELSLPGSFEDYLATLPSRRRSNLRKHLRRLDEGPFELAPIGADELPGAVEEWHELRSRWWRERDLDLDSFHATEAFRDFTRDAAAALLPAGLLEPWRLLHEGRPAGVCINLVDRRAFYVYLAAFEPEVAKQGPGKIQIGHAIRTSIAAGRSLFDFTIGRDDYKYWFGGTEVERPRQTVESGGLRSRAAGMVSSVRDRRRNSAQP
jgi:CelD/BcsL family acetyltransferase involved in cellulose biosynthesis